MKCNEKKSKSDKMHFMVYYNAFSFHFDVKFICKLVRGPRHKRRQECLISSFKQSQLLFRCNVHWAYFLTNFIYILGIHSRVCGFFFLSVFLNWRPNDVCTTNVDTTNRNMRRKILACTLGDNENLIKFIAFRRIRLAFAWETKTVS